MYVIEGFWFAVDAMEAPVERLYWHGAQDRHPEASWMDPFHSDPAAADYTFRRRLRVKGKYQIICTFHENMVQTITVR